MGRINGARSVPLRTSVAIELPFRKGGRERVEAFPSTTPFLHYHYFMHSFLALLLLCVAAHVARSAARKAVSVVDASGKTESFVLSSGASVEYDAGKFFSCREYAVLRQYKELSFQFKN